MSKEEKECLVCGAPQVEVPKSDFSTRGRAIVKWFFFFSFGLTVISLLTPWGPPFMTCLSVTIVLLLVKSSWNEMLIDRQKK